ncbi:hypothetical protein VZT92_017898 [Zoarces viviparus]|uniref:Uncharacterized protein n=1 Tax=Zoarces viviparus TaxID=48416 RepID=A0AAW1EMT3_ZOAVI
MTAGGDMLSAIVEKKKVERPPGSGVVSALGSVRLVARILVNVSRQLISRIAPPFSFQPPAGPPSWRRRAVMDAVWHGHSQRRGPH